MQFCHHCKASIKSLNCHKNAEYRTHELVSTKMELTVQTQPLFLLPGIHNGNKDDNSCQLPFDSQVCISPNLIWLCTQEKIS